MNRKSIHSVLAILALMFGATVVIAHNGVEHVMGTITAMTDTSITVDTVKHTSVTVLIDSTTKFSKNNVEASRKDLKIGDRVAIDAKENSDQKLIGVTVKLGSMANMGHGDHKK